MNDIDDLLRRELEAFPRPEPSPFLARRIANAARSQSKGSPAARWLVPLAVVPPSIWILATTASPLWILALTPAVLLLTFALEPARW